MINNNLKKKNSFQNRLIRRIKPLQYIKKVSLCINEIVLSFFFYLLTLELGVEQVRSFKQDTVTLYWVSADWFIRRV